MATPNDRYMLSDKLAPADLAAIQQELDRLGAAAPYGWGHSLNLGGGGDN